VWSQPVGCDHTCGERGRHPERWAYHLAEDFPSPALKAKRAHSLLRVKPRSCSRSPSIRWFG